MQTAKSIKRHVIVFEPKTSLKYADQITQNSVDVILLACRQLRQSGQHADMDLACEIEHVIGQYTE